MKFARIALFLRAEFIGITELLAYKANALVLTREMVDNMKVDNSTGSPFLDLANMGITGFESGVFDGNEMMEIETLYLMGNSFKEFPGNVFSQIFYSLRNMYLGSNLIDNLENDFHSPNLEVL
jgi:hypothetical protein